MKKHMVVIAAALLLGAVSTQTIGANANEEAFAALDADGNGLLTPEEAAANVDLADSFEDGDDNEDGFLDITEFGKMEVSDE